MIEIDYKRLFALSPTPCLVLSPDFTIVDANPSFLDLTGRARDALLGTRIDEALPDASAAARELCASLDRVLTRRRAETLAPRPYPFVPETGAASARTWTMHQTPILDADGAVALILHQPVEAITVSGAREPRPRTPGVAECGVRTPTHLDTERGHLRLLFEQTPGFVCMLDGADHAFEFANKAYYQLVGHRDLLGKTVREALPELDGQGFYELLDAVFATGKPYLGRAMPMRVQPHPLATPVEKHIDFIYQPIVDEHGTVAGVFVQGHDVSEARRLAREISYQAAHDPLTGVANRREFERRLHAAIEDARGTGIKHALLYLDLDQFKLVNDTCGHAAGDELLRQVARRLRPRLREADTLARLGGDEFAILLRGCPPPPAEQVANELRELVAGLEFHWEGRRFNPTVSIGVVTFCDESLVSKEVLSTADSACFLAKEKGRNRVHVYHEADAEMSARLREMDWVSRLLEAHREERLVLFGQHIVPLAEMDRQVQHTEVLVRLQDTDGSLIAPMAFIPAAERYNLMPMIDRYVIGKALQYLASRRAGEKARMSLAINLSGTTLSEEGFLPFLEEQIARSGVAPQQICFEITETAAVANLSATRELIGALSRLGCFFSLDDFGSGMSSFGYLKHLPVNYVKIDGVFVKNILNDPADRAMVEAVAKVARVMGIQTIAEYVENDAIADCLRELGVHFAQGFGVHRPQPLLPAAD